MIDYFKAEIDKKEIEAVSRVLEGGWVTTGKECGEFEKKFLKVFNFDNTFNALAVTSNTHGLHLAIESFNFQDKSEIIVPAMTFTASAAAIIYSGHIPVIVDCNSDNLIDHKEIQKSITKKTKAILVVHFAGKAADMRPIMEIAKKNNLKVIEDAAHALPCKYKNGNWVGSLGNPTVFSFYANKTMTTGEGGMVITNSKKNFKLMKSKRSHGMNKNVLDRFSGKSKNWEYDIDTKGFKYNLTDIASAMGIVQLDKLFDGQKKREKIAKIYRDNLDKDKLFITSEAEKNGLHAYHLFQIRSKQKPKEFREALTTIFEKDNIGFSVHYKPLNKLKYWKKYLKQQNSFQNSNAHFSGCISLPIYPSLEEKHVLTICDIVNQLLKSENF